jgi:hypothetical protein
VAWWRCEDCQLGGVPIYATNRSGAWVRWAAGPDRGPGQVTGIDYSGGGAHISWENLNGVITEIAYTTNTTNTTDSWVSRRWIFDDPEGGRPRLRRLRQRIGPVRRAGAAPAERPAAGAAGPSTVLDGREGASG